MSRSAQAAPERARFRRFRPPTSLVAVLAIVVTVGFCWALLVPPFQSPDEPSHFAYVQSLATKLELPGKTSKPPESFAEIFAVDSEGAYNAFYPASGPPLWGKQGYQTFLRAAHAPNAPTNDSGGGVNTASQNPPLYYLYGSIGYLFDDGGTVFGQLYSVRLWGVLLLALTALGGWLLAGEVFGRRRQLQLVCAGVAGLEPMVSFMSVAVNPDALTITAWTLGLWLGARVINRRAQALDVIGMALLAAIAILAKADSYALAGADLFAVLFGWLRRPREERRTALPGIAGGAGAIGIPVIGWLVLARSLGRAGINQTGTSHANFNVKYFIDYVWQFYLPRIPSMRKIRTTPHGLPTYKIWYQQGLGFFGWLVVRLPGWIYTAGLLIGGAISVVTIGLLTRLRRARLWLLGYFVLAWVGLLAVLHVTEFRIVITGGGQFLQGRYIIPAVGLLGLALALIVSRLPPRARPAACGLILVGLLALQVVSLSSVLQAYYL